MTFDFDLIERDCCGWWVHIDHAAIGPFTDYVEALNWIDSFVGCDQIAGNNHKQIANILEKERQAMWLIRKRGYLPLAAAAHIWTGEDTACRMSMSLVRDITRLRTFNGIWNFCSIGG
jgi:hypothetical protein